MITFYETDLPNGASHCSQANCGFSLHRGVLVQWDEDEDKRVLDALDAMPSWIVDRLLVVQEHEGTIAFVWDGVVPNGYEEGGGLDVPDGDYWGIWSSTALHGTITEAEVNIWSKPSECEPPTDMNLLVRLPDGSCQYMEWMQMYWVDLTRKQIVEAEGTEWKIGWRT